ncbi:MAG: glycosyltransferase family 39 protein, partial [Myxococcales bacterium]|nr:glycosyltransferase family 39 protein [Myxococcales bacterium]
MNHTPPINGAEAARSSFLGRRAAWSLLALIVVLGGGIRLWGITDRGPMIWDEGLYNDEGAWIYTGARGLLESLEVKREERRTGQDLWKAEDQFRKIGAQQWPFTLWSNRIGRATENAAMMAVVGIQPWVGPLVSAIYGIAGIILVYLVGARWWGRDAGVAAALTLAVMGWHWIYSREGFVETDATFFMILAIALYLRSARDVARHPYWGAFGGGFLWGVALTIQFRWASFALILVAAELLHAWLHRRGLWVHVARFTLMVLGIALPNLLFEVPYYVAHIVARHFEMKLPFYTYVQTLIVHTIIVIKSALHPAPKTWMDWLTFPHGMWSFSGPLMLAIATASFAFAGARA